MDMIIKNAKHVELDTKIVSAILNTQTLKMISFADVYAVTEITKKRLMKT